MVSEVAERDSSISQMLCVCVCACACVRKQTRNERGSIWVTFWLSMMTIRTIRNITSESSLPKLRRHILVLRVCMCRGSAYARRRREREAEIDMDERDRMREKDELEELRLQASQTFSSKLLKFSAVSDEVNFFFFFLV